MKEKSKIFKNYIQRRNRVHLPLIWIFNFIFLSKYNQKSNSIILSTSNFPQVTSQSFFSSFAFPRRKTYIFDSNFCSVPIFSLFFIPIRHSITDFHSHFFCCFSFMREWAKKEDQEKVVGKEGKIQWVRERHWVFSRVERAWMASLYLKTYVLQYKIRSGWKAPKEFSPYNFRLSVYAYVDRI